VGVSTYLFYDIETTGLNKCFDQVLQFAAIRTDKKLKEIERHAIQVKLNCDIIPAPQAVMTHRIGVEQFSQGVNELDAIQKIHTLLNTPNTISVGYNSLGFDDEFLRFSFYRNLFPPYTHQYANGCGRMDIYPITLLYYLFKPNHLLWPTQNGSVNLKLENLNTGNQLFKGQAHNAMVDVEITLALAKKLFANKTMWDFVSGYFEKKSDEARIANNTIGLMVNGKIGFQSHFIAPVIHLGQHQHYKNQSVWLRLDDDNLRKTAANTDIVLTTKIIKKRLAEPPIFLPLKDRYLDLLSDERKKSVADNQQWLSTHPEILKKITDYYQHEKYKLIPERDVDAALYDIGFATPQEENLFKQFHAAKPTDKESIAKRFPNKIRQMQALRIIARHFPEVLSQDAKIEFDMYLQSTPIDFRGEKKLTKEGALFNIEELLNNASLDSEQQGLLKELKGFIQHAGGR